MTRLADRPDVRLTRHYFHALFDMGVLSEAGADAFRRLIMGVVAVFLGAGLLLLRVIAAKYAYLATLDTNDAYLTAVVADHAFLIGVAMWIVAVVTVLVAHGVFPDETDFHILRAMPVSDRMIFGARLVALLLFLGVFGVSAHAALLPVFLVTTLGPWDPPLALGFGAWLTASALGSLFAALLVIVVQGAMVLLAPRGHLLTLASGVRSLMLSMLVVALPLLLQLTAAGDALADGAWWLPWTPPVWFAGLERALLSDVRGPLAGLAVVGVVALLAAAAVAIGTYLQLYRRFDHLMSRPAPVVVEWLRWPNLVRRPRARAQSVLSAVGAFVAITVRRSALHQGIVVAVSSAGAGIVLAALLEVDLFDWLSRGGRPPASTRAAIVWTPFVAMLAAGWAVRSALVVPLDIRANWVFRVTERDDTRLETLRAAMQVVWRVGVVVPVTALAPLHVAAFGARAAAPLAVTLVFGWLYAEVLMRGWARIPFTCSYLPGKRFVPQALIVAVVSFVVFTGGGSLVALLSLELLAPPAVICATVAAAAGLLGVQRRRLWRAQPLEFEDTLSSDAQVLGLSE